MIYADHAATTPISAPALHAMERGYAELWGNPSSIHGPGRRAKDALEEARETVAGVLGAKPREIIFTSGGTESDNLAILGCASLGARTGKRHIISTRFEHHAVLRTLERLEQQGFSVTLLEVHEDGLVRPEELRQALREDTCLVSVMYVNNEVGTLQPVAELGKICRRAGVPFHSDAVQAAGQLPLHVGEDRVDLMSLSAHKFGGPRGVGALYVRQGIPLPPLITGGEQERSRRAGTENLPAILGLSAALEACTAGQEARAAQVAALREQLIEGLLSIPGCYLNGHRTRRTGGIVSVCLEDVSGESMLLLLDREGICASAGSACAAGSLEPSHVLRAMGVSDALGKGALRLSLSSGNTPEEVEAIVRAVGEIATRLRRLRQEAP